eukprot:1185657-Prorocentrum_minimum.AAC.4
MPDMGHNVQAGTDDRRMQHNFKKFRPKTTIGRCLLLRFPSMIITGGHLDVEQLLTRRSCFFTDGDVPCVVRVAFSPYVVRRPNLVHIGVVQVFIKVYHTVNRDNGRCRLDFVNLFSTKT